MEFFSFRLKAILHSRMGVFEMDDEGDDEEQNTGRENNRALEKHKG